VGAGEGRRKQTKGAYIGIEKEGKSRKDDAVYQPEEVREQKKAESPVTKQPTTMEKERLLPAIRIRAKQKSHRPPGKKTIRKIAKKKKRGKRKERWA